jgi:hypothetical protein
MVSLVEQWGREITHGLTGVPREDVMQKSFSVSAWVVPSL